MLTTSRAIPPCTLLSAFGVVSALALTGVPARAQSSAAQSPASPSASVAADPIEGKWVGMAGFPEDRVEIGFEFKRNAKNEIVASLFQPVINFYGLPQPGALKREGNKYAAKESAITLTMENDRLEGTFTGVNAPVSLHRTDKLPAEVPLPDLPKGPAPRWQVKFPGAIFATAALRDGTAYVGGTGGAFEAVRLNDGGVAWAFAAGRPIHGEALATDEHVYFVCDIGFLYKLDRRTGKEVWRYDLGDAQVPRVLPDRLLFEYDYKAPRPALADGVIYVGSGDGALHAVDDATGRRAWRVETKGKIRTDALVDGARVFFTSLDGTVFAVDRTSGKEIWKKNTFAPVTSSPALIDGKLLVGNRGSVLYAMQPATGEIAWRSIFWGSWVESDAVPGDGVFYIGSSDLRRVSALDPKDGRVIWRTDVYGSPWGRPATSGSRIYVGVAGTNPYEIRHLGSLTALDRKTGKIAWRWAMPEWPGSLLNGFTASPAIDGKTLVIGGLDGTLYAFPAE